jgi:hypothetical protein
MAEGARKAACSSVRDHFCFDGNGSVAKAPRHRVTVAHETGTGAQGAGLDFYSTLACDIRQPSLRSSAQAADEVHPKTSAASRGSHGLVLFATIAELISTAPMRIAPATMSVFPRVCTSAKVPWDMAASQPIAKHRLPAIANAPRKTFKVFIINPRTQNNGPLGPTKLHRITRLN